MEHHRRTAHTRFGIGSHLVWTTKRRKESLRDDVGRRHRTGRALPAVSILKGHISQDRVHLFVSRPPYVSASHLMPRVKGKSPRQHLRE